MWRSISEIRIFLYKRRFAYRWRMRNNRKIGAEKKHKWITTEVINIISERHRWYYGAKGFCVLVFFFAYWVNVLSSNRRLSLYITYFKWKLDKKRDRIIGHVRLPKINCETYTHTTNQYALTLTLIEWMKFQWQQWQPIVFKPNGIHWIHLIDKCSFFFSFFVFALNWMSNCMDYRK